MQASRVPLRNANASDERERRPELTYAVSAFELVQCNLL